MRTSGAGRRHDYHSLSSVVAFPTGRHSVSRSSILSSSARLQHATRVLHGRSCKKLAIKDVINNNAQQSLLLAMFMSGGTEGKALFTYIHWKIGVADFDSLHDTITG